MEFSNWQSERHRIDIGVNFKQICFCIFQLIHLFAPMSEIEFPNFNCSKLAFVEFSRYVVSECWPGGLIIMTCFSVCSHLCDLFCCVVTMLTSEECGIVIHRWPFFIPDTSVCFGQNLSVSHCGKDSNNFDYRGELWTNVFHTSGTFITL